MPVGLLRVPSAQCPGNSGGVARHVSEPPSVQYIRDMNRQRSTHKFLIVASLGITFSSLIACSKAGSLQSNAAAKPGSLPANQIEKQLEMISTEAKGRVGVSAM